MNKIIFFVLILGLALGLSFIWQNRARFADLEGENQNRKTPTSQMTEPQFRDKLAGFRMERDKLIRHISQLESSKDRSVKFLKDNNISKVSEAQGKPEAEVALQNLKATSAKVEDLNEQINKFDTVISRIAGMLDKLETDRIHAEVKLSDEQEIELRALVKGLEDELNIGDASLLLDDELDQLLQQELQKD